MRITLMGLALLALALTVNAGCGCGSDSPWPFGTVRGRTAHTFSTSDQFAVGNLLNLDHEGEVPDQLELNRYTEPLPFINVAVSGRGTMARIDTTTGEVIGEYHTAPDGRGLNPSRTTVDLFGNVWLGNRDEYGYEDTTSPNIQFDLSGEGTGSVVKIGIVVGGTRGNKEPDGSFTEDPNGEYLQPPFAYSTAADRDGDGLIRTSRGLGDLLDWPDVTDGAGAPGEGTDARVEDALDECILVYQRTPDAAAVRHVSVDADNNVWVGGYPFQQQMFYLLDQTTGAFLDSFDARDFEAGGYGGLIDGNGVLWSASISESALLRYDIAAGTAMSIPVSSSYGLGIDTNGYLWNSTFCGAQIVKVAPDGTIQTDFPKDVPDGSCIRGVAVTPSDNHVWCANSGDETVTRLDNDGDWVKTVTVGDGPTGVAVDANGKVWSANQYSHDLSRIDPTGGLDGLGEVDLTVDLGEGAYPYNYSDMTGAVAIGATSPQGTWTVVIDSENEGTGWGQIDWNEEAEGHLPDGAFIGVEARAAETAAGLASETFVDLGNGVPMDLVGRFLEVRLTLKANALGESPVLSDITITEQ